MRHVLVSTLLLVSVAALADVPGFEEVRSAWRPSEAYLLDRKGEVLHELRVDFTKRRLDWVAIDEISPALTGMVIQAEDRRFHQHAGVDWWALASALAGYLSGAKARGASTLSMQIAAMLDPELTPESNRRSIAQKLMQVRAALRLEEHWTKDQILEAYLNLTSFYGELQGIGAAARELFGKRPSGLSAAESTVLAALLPSPNRRGARLGKRACAIAGVDDNTPRCRELMRLAEGLSDSQRPSRLPATLAPHLAHARLRDPGERLQTTLDRRLQRLALEALAQQLAGLRSNNVRDGAALIVDNQSGEVLAYVGAAGPYSNAIHVDGVRAPRQAGSTLKPFLYALAIEQGYLTAASLLDDSPINLGTASGLYIPQNYDRDFKGWVSVRTALSGSLNVPAVRTLVVTGVDAFRDRLQSLGYRGITRDGDYYGYSLALGSAEISLFEQVNAYRTLANGGIVSPLKIWRNQGTVDPPARAMSEDAAYIVADILSDRAGRALTFGLDNPLVTRFWSAVKTGTSKDMRDNWCIGFSSEYTVGVWVGNFEGDAMHRVSGVTGAAPVWLAIMNALQAGSPGSEPRRPSHLIARTVSFVPAVEPRRQEWFIPGTETRLVRLANPGALRPSILSPPDGVTIALDPDIPLDKQLVLFSTSTLGDASLVLDGKTIGRGGGALKWQPAPGKHTLTLQAPGGRAYDTVSFTVRGLKPNYAYRSP
ncbi:MAG: penicillin-binding protein 1C [Gammaproteobacteria bacterium]